MSDRLFPSFSSVDLEFTNICYNNCSICPRSALKRNKGFLKEEDLTLFIKKFKNYKFLLSISGMGDPLLHPQFDEFIIRLKKEGFTVGVVVNIASLIDEGLKNLNKLIKSSPNSITISVPSFKNETLRKIYSNTINKEKVFTAIFEVAERLKNKSKIRVSTLITEIKEDFKNYKDMFNKMKISLWTSKIHSRGGNLRESILYKNRVIKQNSECNLFLFHTFISHKGEVLACCHDLKGETAFACIEDDPNEILNRKKKIIENLPFFSLCNMCDEPLRDIGLPEDFHTLSYKQLFRKIKINNSGD